MKHSGHRKLLCAELLKLNAFILLGYQTVASILVYKDSLERAGLNMYAENTQQQITFLSLLPCSDASILVYKYRRDRTGFMKYAENTQPQLTFLELLPCVSQSLLAPHGLQFCIPYTSNPGHILNDYVLPLLINKVFGTS